MATDIERSIAARREVDNGAGGDTQSGHSPATLEGQESNMTSKEEEWEPAPDVDMTEAQEFATADPDPWEGGNIENERPEPWKQDANGPGAGDPGAAGIQAEDAGADGPQPGETVDKEQDNGNAGEEEPDGKEAEPTELKIVLHVRNGRANAGVWRPGADPHLEVFLETDPGVLLSELPGLIERARSRWADNPMRPKYSPPKPKQPSGQSSAQPSAQPPSADQPGNGQEQTGMARLF